MTYELNPNTIVFSYTREELFECIAKIVAHPHNTITEHDNSRALAVMVVFDDYFTNYLQSDNNGGHCVYECDAMDFTQFVKDKLGISDCGGVDVDEVLK
jgi:hypothetical protein